LSFLATLTFLATFPAKFLTTSCCLTATLPQWLTTKCHIYPRSRCPGVQRSTSSHFCTAISVCRQAHTKRHIDRWSQLPVHTVPSGRFWTALARHAAARRGLALAARSMGTCTGVIIHCHAAGTDTRQPGSPRAPGSAGTRTAVARAQCGPPPARAIRVATRYRPCSPRTGVPAGPGGRAWSPRAPTARWTAVRVSHVWRQQCGRRRPRSLRHPTLSALNLAGPARACLGLPAPRPAGGPGLTPNPGRGPGPPR
jgi:hypothetical protein